MPNAPRAGLRNREVVEGKSTDLIARSQRRSCHLPRRESGGGRGSNPRSNRYGYTKGADVKYNSSFTSSAEWYVYAEEDTPQAMGTLIAVVIIVVLVVVEVWSGRGGGDGHSQGNGGVAVDLAMAGLATDLARSLR